MTRNAHSIHTPRSNLTPAMRAALDLIDEHGHVWVTGSGVHDAKPEYGLPSVHRVTANRLLRAGLVRWHLTDTTRFGVLPYLIRKEV